MAEPSVPSGKNDSMEDILQSIKRIIEDDNAPKPDDSSEDVLDLTEAVAPDGKISSIGPMPKPVGEAPASNDVVQSIDTMFAPKPSIPMEEGLISEETTLAAVAALRPITEGGIKDYSIPRVDSLGLRNGNTVEDLVLEALRPMLKSWLDEHLPMIVQKIVEKEVKRIVTFHLD